MKISGKIWILLFPIAILAACNSVSSTPTSDSVDVGRIALAIAQTGIALTQTAVPTATYIPTPFPISPTAIPPEPTRIPPSSYEDKIDYAMATAPRIYNLLPYINEVNPYGEYSGCIRTYDFHNFVAYSISLQMEPVKAAFLRYFSREGWEFTEETSELVGYDNNIPRTTYDVYRISSKDIPAFERLRVILTDESSGRGKDYIDVRAEINHIETKKNFKYLADFYCHNDEMWLWIRLHK